MLARLRRVCRGFALLALLGVASSAFAQVPLPRVVSINACTDQLVLALAEPSQILGLSPYARDAVRAFSAREAAAYPLLSGEAEDVLMLQPDLIVAGLFTKRATRELLKAKNYRVVEFDSARTIAEARAQIVRMGELLGQPTRAAALATALDRGIAEARGAVAAPARRLRVLPLSRRGWVAGADSMMTSLLAAVGLANDAEALGIRSGGFATLESIVAARPDLLLVSSAEGAAEDQGSAFLLHPALERLYPAERRLVVPERLTVCGGPMLVEALTRLGAELRRVAHP